MYRVTPRVLNPPARKRALRENTTILLLNNNLSDDIFKSKKYQKTC